MEFEANATKANVTKKLLKKLKNKKKRKQDGYF